MPVLTNPKHEAFAQAVGTGENAATAYRRIWKSDGTSVDQCACRLAKKDKVRLRIDEIRSEYQRHAQKQVEKRFLTLDRKRELLALIAETPVGEIDEHHVLCQEYTRYEQGGARGKLKRGPAEEGNEVAEQDYTVVKVKMPDKLKAIELDARLAGEFKDKVELTGSLEHRVAIDETRRKRVAELRKAKKTR